jgi:hypothetical protein
MSEARRITLASTSHAEDAAWLAVADVAAVATDLGIDYRLIGGNSVALLVHVHRATTQVPDRATADADMGASFEVCADPRLVPAITALGYDRQSGNRFIRTQGARALVIAVLARRQAHRGRLPTGSTDPDAAVLLHRHFAAPSSDGPRRATPRRANQPRIRARTAHVVPNPTTSEAGRPVPR